MTSMDGQGRPETPLAAGTRWDRDIECVAVLHRMASIGIKADAEDSSRQPRETT